MVYRDFREYYDALAEDSRHVCRLFGCKVTPIYIYRAPYSGHILQKTPPFLALYQEKKAIAVAARAQKTGRKPYTRLCPL